MLYSTNSKLIQPTTMQLRSGKTVLSTSVSTNVKGHFNMRSGRLVIRAKYTPRAYIKRKENIELRSGRLVSHKKYNKRAYIKRKKNIELRSGRLVSHEKYTPRPYIKRQHQTKNSEPQKSDAHVTAMFDYYKSNFPLMHSTLLHITNNNSRRTIDMMRKWRVSEHHREAFMNFNNEQ